MAIHAANYKHMETGTLHLMCLLIRQVISKIVLVLMYIDSRICTK